MKRYFFAALWLAMFLVVHETGLLMCEDQKELPFEDGNPLFYVDGKDGIRHYAGLLAHGDYTKLKLIIRSKEVNYYPGEPVNIKFFVRNDSDSEVHIWDGPSPYSCAGLWKLFHSNYDEAAKTPKLEKMIKERQGRYGFSWSIGGGPPRYLKLKPGQRRELGRMCLNDFFDLSKPDTYELTCFNTTFIGRQEYQPPLQSNTLTFRILDPTDQEPVRPREEYLKTPYTNPPPGKEVFKQPKPPKNVFYNVEYQIIDVSPYTYYHEWREKQAAAAIERQALKERQEAQTAKPPDEVKPASQ
ncbi:MAG: hypothetical protein FWC50_09770 [Planctomycetaceae bacterium]|nr:hypothetical protein [Planctomycetaceae bacterium]